MDKTTYFILIDSLWIYIINQYKSPGEHLQGSESMIQTARRHGQLFLKVAAGKLMVLLPWNKSRKQN